MLTTPGRYTTSARASIINSTQNNTLMFRYGITHSDVQDNGIGGFDLISRGYHSQFTNQTVQAADTPLIGPPSMKPASSITAAPRSPSPTRLAPRSRCCGRSTAAASTIGHTFDTQNSYELQNYTSMLHGTHSWRFGVRLRGQTDDSVSPQNFNGTFTFGGGAWRRCWMRTISPCSMLTASPCWRPSHPSSATAARCCSSNSAIRRPQIRALGGGATQFSISTGHAGAGVHQVDAGIFAGDEWRVRPNLTLSLGCATRPRATSTTARDFAPRVAVAWAPGGKTGKRAKTVLRAGFGCSTTASPWPTRSPPQRYNGMVQQQYVVTNPDFFPNRSAARGAGRVPIHAGDSGDQLAAARAVHDAVGLHAGAPVAGATPRWP